jgi:hypothetical protein
MQLEVISLCIEIEKLVLEVHIVAQRCIKNYNDCETRNQRFKQFDELTSMLGDGRPPTVGKRGAVVLTCDPPRLLMQLCTLVPPALRQPCLCFPSRHQIVRVFIVSVVDMCCICSGTGFADWRERGVVGVRPTMMKFFLTAQVSGTSLVVWVGTE